MTSTPVLTNHARQRCAEMGISTKVAKRIVQHPTMTYPGRHYDGIDSVVVFSDLEPEYLVVLREGVVVTVTFNAPGVFYRRCGTTYETVHDCHD